MALYEANFIANQELTSKQVENLAQNFTDYLKHEGGKLVRKEYWGIRNFAYPIKKQKKGHYVMLCIDCPEDAIAKFDNKVKTQEEVLKYFAVNVPNFTKEESQLAKANNEN